jgi:hypothetical protein
MLPVLLWVGDLVRAASVLRHWRSLLLKLIEQTIDESNSKAENIFDNAMVVIEFILTL